MRRGARYEDGTQAEDNAAPDEGGPEAGEPMRDIAKDFNVSHSAISRP